MSFLPNTVLFPKLKLLISSAYTSNQITSPCLLEYLVCQVPLIIDTDASFDVDDVVAICMAHALMDNGEVVIKDIVHDAGIMALYKELQEST